MYLLAIDIGSTSIKAIIYDYGGNIISSGRRKTQVFFKEEKHKNFAFWMPDNIWDCVCDSTKEAISKVSNPNLIKGISVTGFACDGVPIDEKGNWIYPFISWHDTRTIEQLKWLEKNISFEEIYSINGQRPWIHNTILRNLWIKENLPNVYKRIYKWLLIEDYINFKLCSAIATDYSLASTTLVFDQKNLRWSEKLFNFFGIDMNIYPQPKPSGTFLGEVTNKASKDTGLKEGTPVVLGGLDGLFGVYAAAGDQSDSMVGVVGTYEHYHKCLDKPILRKEGLDSSIICQAHVIKDKYGVYGVAVSSGVLEWFKDNLCKEEEIESKNTGRNIWEILMEKASKSKLGSNGIFMLPDIFGSACPIQDNFSRGVFIGISSAAKKEDFIRAVIEGLNYKGLELYEAINNYTTTGVANNENNKKVIVTGGATKNKFWMQNKADVYGKIIEVPEIEEATPLGAAMVAGIGIGAYKDFKDAYERVKRPVRKYYPDEKNHKKYAEYYEGVYKKMYSFCKDLNKLISTKIG